MIMWVYQRKYIISRKDSNKKSTHTTSPRSVCSILHYLSVCITAINAGGERLGESFPRKTKWGAVCSKSDIYSLILPLNSSDELCLFFCIYPSSMLLLIIYMYYNIFFQDKNQYHHHPRSLRVLWYICSERTHLKKIIIEK